jgi:predicted transcriptional regulator
LAEWSLLTNHARLLLAIEHEPELRVRDIAERLHLSERGVHLILRDLREAGYVKAHRDRSRDGRRIYLSVVPTKPFRHEPFRHQTVGQLLELLAESESARRGNGSAGAEE